MARTLMQNGVLSPTKAYTHTHLPTVGCRTCGDGSDKRLDGDGPGVVPGPDDEHHSQRLRTDVDGVGEGHQVLLHGSGGCPFLQFPEGKGDLPFQTQSLIELGSHLALRMRTVNLDAVFTELLLYELTSMHFSTAA